jgi:hypothetical protein
MVIALQVDMILQANDRFCNMRTVGGDIVQCVLDFAQTLAFGDRVVAGVEDMQDGTYTLRFSLGRVGKWIMTIMILDEKVRPMRLGKGETCTLEKIREKRKEKGNRKRKRREKERDDMTGSDSGSGYNWSNLWIWTECFIWVELWNLT